MNIEMLSHKTLKEIDEEFHKRFPFLKLAFFSKEHIEGELSSNSDVVDLNQSLGEFGTDIVDWKIEGLTIVGDLEKSFQENTGLSVQVMRKSGDLWLQTSRTDHLTLAEQNAKGRGTDEPLTGNEEPSDYHEQE